MKKKLVIVAPDSFKGSISSSEYCFIAERVAQEFSSVLSIRCFPMADGGEGTAEILHRTFHAKIKQYQTIDANGQPLNVAVIITQNREVIIESALVVGLNLPSIQETDVRYRTTSGLGELIHQIYSNGYHNIQIGLGGSGTNDGGFGMLHYLGIKFLDVDRKVIESFFELDRLSLVDFSDFQKTYPKLKLKCYGDVSNPLTGVDGATRVFGSQKGVTKELFHYFESRMELLSRTINQVLGTDISKEKGAGAAGGLGFALRVLGADLYQGAELFINLYGLQEQLKDADLLITGEGKSDAQTLCGKLPVALSKLANKLDVPCVLLSGEVDTEALEDIQKSFTSCFSISHGPATLEAIIEDTQMLLESSLRSIFHLITAQFSQPELPKS